MTITLGAAPATELSVVDPQGKPVAGARVLPTMVDDVPIPDVVAQAHWGHDRFAWSRADGGVSGDSSPGGSRRSALVSARSACGSIEADSSDTKDHSARIALAPVGRVVGRLVPPGNEPIKGVTVRATTQEGGYEGSGRGGMAEVAVEESGRFEIGAIVAGTLEIELLFDPQDRHAASARDSWQNDRGGG